MIRIFQATVAKLDKNYMFFKSKTIYVAILDFFIFELVSLFNIKELPSFIIVEKSERFFPKQLHYLHSGFRYDTVAWIQVL